MWLLFQLQLGIPLWRVGNRAPGSTSVTAIPTPVMSPTLWGHQQWSHSRLLPFPLHPPALERMWSHHPETQTLPALKNFSFWRGILLIFPLNASGFLQPHAV